MKNSRPTRSTPFLALLMTAPALAATYDNKDFHATFDSTFSAGVLYRLHDPSPLYYGSANGGQQLSVNADDGNLNYGRGVASKVFKGTHELEMKWRNLGAFVRGTYFYDMENSDRARRRTALSDEALERVGKDAQFLDAYIRGDWEVFGRTLDLRFGRQVLNLGESTFIPNGLNVINPVDVSRLRTPGAELREALLPVNMARASYSFSDTVSLGAFWLLEYKRTEIDPVGSYFSTSDFASRGGKYVYLGFGQIADNSPFGAISRAGDKRGNGLKQYGADLRISLPNLNDTEVGLYFANYHSRLPVISAITPTQGINPDLTGPLTAALIRGGIAPGQAAGQAAALFNLLRLSLTNPGALTPGQVALLQAESTKAAIAGARQIALLTAAGTGRYQIEFPEDIRMLGASFNTMLGRTGIAWQGEVAYKHNVPLQVDDVELLFAALSALDTPGGSAFGTNNQLGNYAGRFGAPIQGFRREGVWTAQSTFTKVFGPMFGSNQTTIIAEVGGLWVPDLPAQSELRYDAPGTFTSGSQAAMNGTGNPLPATPASAFADPFSWGYQTAVRLEYNNLPGGINLLPAVAFVHDVSGNSPLPLGNFVRGRKSINLVAEFTWQNSWSWELRYVNFFGGGRYNLIADRDFVSTTLKYSF
ncbi:MAG: DUF1302 domain-containing protein [Opitutaceae bacterium]|nr:DUF1302 domain-containing protein [Opitutaceae bacterium]